MRNLNVELYVIERAAVLFPGEVIMWDFRADTIFNTPVVISTSRSSTVEEIEREHIMQVQAESPTLQDAAESLRYQRHYPWGNESLTNSTRWH
jgi:hypothetical protein